MRWIVRLLVLYAAVFVIVAVVVASVPTDGTSQPAHPRTDLVSHSDYELHRSIAHVP